MPPRLPRRVTRAAAWIFLVAGLLASGEVVITVAWQEPITALSAYRGQRALGNELEKTRETLASRLPDSSLSAMTPQQRIAALAQQLDRRAKVGHALGRISIPRLGIRFVFVAGATSKTLEKGPGHYKTTSLPGQSGTVGIAGHRTTYLAPFRKLDRLHGGDRIELAMPYGRFTYRVEDRRVVSPSRITVLRSAGHDRLVLTTCTPLFSAARRLVVTAREVARVPLGAAVGDPFPHAPEL